MAVHDFDRRMRIIKYILLSITPILVLFSAFIITLGTSIYEIYQYVAFFLYYKFCCQAISIIVIGAIILVVSLYGGISALRESTWMINSFAVILSLALVLEVYAVVVAVNMRQMVYWMLYNNIRMFFNYYNEDYSVKGAFDRLQSGLHCCGLDSNLDWESANMTVPRSCCEVTTEDILRFEVCTTIYTEGCLPVVFYLAYQTACLLGALALTVAFLQIIGLVASSLSLVKSIRRVMSDRCGINDRLINDYTPIP